MKIQLNNLATVSLPLLIEPELNLENSNVSFSVYDEANTLMFSGSGSLTDVESFSLTTTKVKVTASFVVPETFDSELYIILFSIETPEQLKYTTQTTLELEQVVEESNATSTYSLHTMPCAIEATFGYLAHSKPSVILTDVEVLEGGTAVIPVKLSMPVNQHDSYLVYATVSNTATLDNFEYTSGRLDFELGDDSAEIHVPTKVIAGIQTDKNFLVKVLAVSNLELFTQSCTCTILESSTPVLTCQNTEVKEEDGVAIFHLVLSEPCPNQTVTVAYSTQDGSALADTDYIPVNGVAVIPKGYPATVVVVPLIDAPPPSNAYLKDFSLVLSNSNVTLGNLVATCTIQDDDYNVVEFPQTNIQVESGQLVDIPISIGKLQPTAEYVVNLNLEQNTAIVNVDFDYDSILDNPFVTNYDLATGCITLKTNSHGLFNLRVQTLKRGVAVNPRFIDVTVKEVISGEPNLKVGVEDTVRVIIYGD